MYFIFGIIVIIVAIIFRVASKRKNNKQEAFYGTLGILVGIFIAAIQTVTVIPAGHVGVIDFLGNVSDNTLKAGVNFVNPVARVVTFSVKTQEMKEVMTVPSKEGLSVQLEISLLYHLNPDNANRIYKEVGENYRDVIIIPYFRSAVRGVTAKYEARALYTSEREMLADEIVAEITKLVEDRGVTIERAPLRQIVLPPGLTGAIEEKLKAEQESQRMQFVLEKERQEAQRKEIEAKGISDFQLIVSQGISQQLLMWKGIEATEKLANSTNTKVIVIGNSENGLPLILGGNN